MLSHLISIGGKGDYSTLISDGPKDMQPSTAISIVRYLVRRRLVEEEGTDIRILPAGEKAAHAYKPLRPTPSSVRQITIHGPKPEGWVRPTVVQWWSADVEEKTARLKKCRFIQAVHPYSPNALKKVQTMERMLTESLAKLHDAMVEQNRCIETGKDIPCLDPHAKD